MKSSASSRSGRRGMGTRGEDDITKDSAMKMNLEHNESIRIALARILGHPVFAGIMEQDPLPIKVGAESGVEEPFDLEVQDRHQLDEENV
jgi:hypothetical protein